jgi:AraC-like DNA-binding protein
MINKIGYRESIRINNLDWNNYFILMEGANQSKINNYQTSIDSIIKSLPHLLEINDYPKISEAYYYLGRSFYLNKNSIKGVYYLQKMDSIFWKNNYLLPEQREGYELLVQFYKERNDTKNHLEYINKLLKFDSICNVKNRVLSKKIYSEYDTPILLKEKQQLIDSLNKSKLALSNRLKWFLSLLILAVLMMVYLFYRQKQYKNRFETISQQVEDKKEKSKAKTKTKSGKTLPKAQVEIILKRINNFEKELGFLEKNINLAILATRLKTNTSYLSIVFNHYKNQKLSDYLNELRINYALQILPKDKKLQQYTIKALAGEFGYNTAESFSKAFFRKTEVYPSFFIKELNKDKT